MEIDKLEKKIILIGNGPSVLNYNFGEVIDSFEEVVRFNNFETKGYKEKIGSKTTIWVRNNSYRGLKDRDVSKFKKIYIASPDWNFRNTKQILRKYKKGKAFIIPYRSSLNLRLDLDVDGPRSKNRSRRGWPTSGLIALNYFLTKYKVVFIHGFDHFYGENHYFNNEKMFSFIHNIKKKEAAWVKNKIKEGKVYRLKDNFKSISSFIDKKD